MKTMTAITRMVGIMNDQATHARDRTLAYLPPAG
jgi:hypothetical protein